MARYTAKRLLQLIPTVLAVIFIVFTIMYFTPGDPGTSILGQTATPEAIAQKNHELGYDLPYLQRLGNYVVDILHGDFGNSWKQNQPVFTLIFQRLPVTVTLAFFAILVAVGIGIPLGVLSAVKQYSIADFISTTTAMLLAAIPEFWLGLMLMLLFCVKIQLLPLIWWGTPSNFVLPVLTLALPTAAALLRLTRATMLETIRQDYIRTARSKGARESRVIFRHALKNSLLPVITVIGTSFGAMLGGTVMIEIIYNMPGLGQLMYTAIQAKDVPLVMAAVIFLAVLFCLIMLLVDLVQAFIDPRIKSRYVKKRPAGGKA